MKAVVFDMDGVLFDTERLSISCWMETAQKMGLGDIREGAYGCIGLNRTDSRIFIKGLYGESFPYDEFRAQNSALFQEKLERDGLPVKKGAREILSWLKKKGVKTAVGTLPKLCRQIQCRLLHQHADGKEPHGTGRIFSVFSGDHRRGYGGTQ